jgi:hypothetical protein
MRFLECTPTFTAFVRNKVGDEPLFVRSVLWEHNKLGLCVDMLSLDRLVGIGFVCKNTQTIIT